MQLTTPKTDHEIAIAAMPDSRGLTSITSVSGGKSSAYMALNYPTDHYVFACVLTSDPNCRIHDKGLLREIQNKIPSFEGSRELNQTLINILRLEQELGKSIHWVHGMTFDELIDWKMLPNHLMRFCTTYLKLMPIWEWTYSNIFDSPHDIVSMNIGFRADEPHRVFKMLGAKPSKTGWNWDNLGKCEDFQVTLKCDIDGQFKGKHRHQKKEWRIRQAPMFIDGITRLDVLRFWDRKGWRFPEVSNCDYCFFHRTEEHHQQFTEHPERAQWWIDQEAKRGATFNKSYALKDALYGSEVDTPLFDLLGCACSD